MILHPVAVASDVDDMAVVHKAVDESRRHDLVAQHGAVLVDRQVSGAPQCRPSSSVTAISSVNCSLNVGIRLTW